VNERQDLNFIVLDAVNHLVRTDNQFSSLQILKFWASATHFGEIVQHIPTPDEPIY
jgi:hypothetical protein